MDTKTFVVNEQDMKRYGLMRKVWEGKVTLKAAALALGVSYRQAKRLKARAVEGLEAMGHRNRCLVSCQLGGGGAASASLGAVGGALP